MVALGPWNGESRPAMSFVFTGMNKKKLSASDFQKIFSEMKADKEDWVKGEHKGELVKFENLKEVKVGSNSGYFIGAEFKINGIHFIERSYYLACKDEYYNLKYNIRHEHLKHQEAIMEIVESFKCD